MPAGLRFDEAVVCEDALYADTNLRALAPEPGDKILIYGASGAIGTAAVQLAKYYGAEVTAVVATRQIDLAKSLGADSVIDYTAQDFTRVGETFDFVFDAVGKASFLACRRLLKPDGVFSATDLGPWNENVLHMMRSAIGRSKRFVFPIPRSTQAFVEFLRDRLETDEFHGVIDRKYPLAGDRHAHRYVETGQKTGIVIVDVVPADEHTQRQVRQALEPFDPRRSSDKAATGP